MARPRKNIDIVTVKQVKVGSLRIEHGTGIRSPEDAAKILDKYLDGADREHFVVMCLNTKNEVNAIHTVSIGSLNSSIVTPREVFKIALLANAASIIFGHNHPSGNPQPSQEDISVTKRLIQVGEIHGIDILDHIIVGDSGQFYSLKEKGMI